jgi:hypothetical protein
MTENGGAAPAAQPLCSVPGTPVFTGTNVTLGNDRMAVTPDTCSGWTATTGDATFGSASATNSRWSASCITSCERLKAPIYCFQQ